MNLVYLSLGSNLGNRYENLVKAVEMLDISGVKTCRMSNVYETSPWGFNAPTRFLNQVLEAETIKSVNELHQIIINTESILGRVRSDSEGYVSRTIDIDILFFNDEIVNTGDLCIPHPRMHERKFVLVPLTELIPDYIHPLLILNIGEILARCIDTEKTTLYKIKGTN